MERINNTISAQDEHAILKLPIVVLCEECLHTKKSSKVSLAEPIQSVHNMKKEKNTLENIYYFMKILFNIVFVYICVLYLQIMIQTYNILKYNNIDPQSI